MQCLANAIIPLWATLEFANSGVAEINKFPTRQRGTCVQILTFFSAQHLNHCWPLVDYSGWEKRYNFQLHLSDKRPLTSFLFSPSSLTLQEGRAPQLFIPFPRDTDPSAPCNHCPINGATAAGPKSFCLYPTTRSVCKKSWCTYSIIPIKKPCKWDFTYSGSSAL